MQRLRHHCNSYQHLSASMQIFKYALVFAVCFALVDFTEAFRFRRVIRKVGREIKRVVNQVKDVLQKTGACPSIGISCPMGGGSGGSGCHVRPGSCKRSVPTGEIIVPFSDEFSDYDENGDKQITFEEFQFAIMKTLIMADPDELLTPFLFADVDDDGTITLEEFQGAPFLFKHVYHPGIDVNATVPIDGEDNINVKTNVSANVTSPAA